jgi:hypothetical protein
VPRVAGHEQRLIALRSAHPSTTRKDIMKRIKHNDLLPWFIQDHKQLPAGYLRSCEKFFKSFKPQAASNRRQASSLTMKE